MADAADTSVNATCSIRDPEFQVRQHCVIVVGIVAHLTKDLCSGIKRNQQHNNGLLAYLLRNAKFVQAFL
jgi:hypothetical protein